MTDASFIDRVVEGADLACSSIAWNEPDLFEAIKFRELLEAGEAMAARLRDRHDRTALPRCPTCQTVAAWRSLLASLAGERDA